MLDQPGDRFGLGRAVSQTRPQFAGDLGAGGGVVLRPALGDIVQEHRQIEHPAILNARHELARQRMVLDLITAFDFRQDADRSEQVLADRVVVIHVELHHRHDLVEVGDEPAENAGFVHQPQHRFGVIARGQDIDEEPIGFGIVLKIGADQLQRPGEQRQRIGMERQVVFVGQMENPDDVDRVAFEHRLVDDIDAVMIDDEIA